MNVLLDPVKGLSLIEKPSVQISVFANLLACQESKCAHAVIDLDEDHVVAGLSNDFCPVEVLICVSSVASPLDEEPYWQLGFSGSVTWSVNAYIQAVFLRGVTETWSEESKASSLKLQCLLLTDPRLRKKMALSGNSLTRLAS